MKLVKYGKPVSSLDQLFNQFSRELWPGDDESTSVDRKPRTNISETKDAFLFTMEMPGLSKKDVKVTIEGQTLQVTGEKKTKEESTEDGMLRREIRSTRFFRSFELGSHVDADNIKAKIEDGLLTLTVPKSAASVGREIDIA